jgi:hypothetical protein
MPWQPDPAETISNSQNWMAVLTSATEISMQQDIASSVANANAATLFGNLLMSYITWANNYAPTLMNGGKNPETGKDYTYLGEDDKGMSSDSNGTSAIMNQFSTSNENWEMLMKNSATSDANSSNTLMSQTQSIADNGDTTSLQQSLAADLANPD